MATVCHPRLFRPAAAAAVVQRQFNKSIFEVEQAEYESEGVDWTYIEFRDNQPVLDLIEAAPDGILAFLDAQVNSGGDAATKDSNFVSGESKGTLGTPSTQ